MNKLLNIETLYRKCVITESDYILLQYMIRNHRSALKFWEVENLHINLQDLTYFYLESYAGLNQVSPRSDYKLDYLPDVFKSKYFRAAK